MVKSTSQRPFSPSSGRIWISKCEPVILPFLEVKPYILESPWPRSCTHNLAEEMDQADDELRVTIQHIWPLQAKKILDLLIPRNAVLNNGKLTVGKIYAGLLILESWRNTRFGQIDSGLPVSAAFFILIIPNPIPYEYINPQHLFRAYFSCCFLYRNDIQVLPKAASKIGLGTFYFHLLSVK